MVFSMTPKAISPYEVATAPAIDMDDCFGCIFNEDFQCTFPTKFDCEEEEIYVLVHRVSGLRMTEEQVIQDYRNHKNEHL